MMTPSNDIDELLDQTDTALKQGTAMPLDDAQALLSAWITELDNPSDVEIDTKSLKADLEQLLQLLTKADGGSIPVEQLNPLLQSLSTGLQAVVAAMPKDDEPEPPTSGGALNRPRRFNRRNQRMSDMAYKLTWMMIH